MLFLYPPSSYSLRPPQSLLSSLKPRRSPLTSSPPAHRYLKHVLKFHTTTPNIYTTYLSTEVLLGFFFFLHSSQMQNLVLCSQQGAVASSSSSSTPQPQLHGLNVRHSSGGTTQIALPSLPVPQLKSLSSQAQGLQGAKNGLTDASSEPAKMSDGANEMSTRVISMSHNMSTTTNHPLINTGKKAINTYSVCRITNRILFCHPALILIMK